MKNFIHAALASASEQDSALHHRAQGSSHDGEAMRLEGWGTRSNTIEASHGYRTQKKAQSRLRPEVGLWSLFLVHFFAPVLGLVRVIHVIFT